MGAALSLAAASMTAQKPQTGQATYYSNKWHGRRTASGLRYHRDSLYCAHRTLPFGTLVRVTDPKTGKSVIVKVVDRGPFGKGKIVDLSMAAARSLDMVSKGVIRVELEVVNDSIEATLSEPAGADPALVDSLILETIVPLDSLPAEQ